jgi:hypothetical protein
MSNNQFRRNLRLLASTSVLACAMIGAPVSVRVQLDGPGWHFEAPLIGSGVSRHIPGEHLEPGTADLGSDRSADAERRKALARLGLGDGTSYEPPVLLTLSRAQAASGGDDGASGGDSGGDSDGDSGGDDGPSGGADGDSGGAGASGGGTEGASGGTEGASGGTPGNSGTVGASGGSFGDMEQVGPSLSEDEEAAAIVTGWQ